MSRWLLYALLSLFWWSLFGFLAKVGADRISPYEMQIFFTVGMIPLVAAAIVRRQAKVETDGRGIAYGVLNGIFSGLGLLAYYAAMKVGKASVVGPVTALYPGLTVVLALTLLQEKMNKVQGLGLVLALGALVILSR